MNGMITHEESQAVTLAFTARGHRFYSCDLQECSGGRKDLHIVSDCFKAVDNYPDIDFLGMHPVCKYLANSGVSWLTSKKKKKGYAWSDKYQIFMNESRYHLMIEAAFHFNDCLEKVKEVGKGYVENPIMHKYAMELIGVKPTQIIQPYMFGHPERKATCLWIVGLPKLIETNNVYNEMVQLPKKQAQRVHYASPGPERAKLRSKTYAGIAEAMATQWSKTLTP